MITTNQAGWDRTVRVLIGGVLLYLGWAGGVAGWLSAVLIGVGLVLVITGLVGWCPLYSLLGISTLHRPATGIRH